MILFDAFVQNSQPSLLRTNRYRKNTDNRTHLTKKHDFGLHKHLRL